MSRLEHDNTMVTKSYLLHNHFLKIKNLTEVENINPLSSLEHKYKKININRN